MPALLQNDQNFYSFIFFILYSFGLTQKNQKVQERKDIQPFSFFHPDLTVVLL